MVDDESHPDVEAGHPGPLALVGGRPWTDGCTFDQVLWEATGRPEVVVVPTGAAYEHPDRLVDAARQWFAGFAAEVRPAMVLDRSDADDDGLAGQIGEARFIYLAGPSPLHLRSVLKDSKVWDAIRRAWSRGAVLAATDGGAMVVGDPMVDPRGGALTLGLGLVRHLAVLPHADTWSDDKAKRTVKLATGHLRIAAVDGSTALIRTPTGTWESAGAGEVTVYVDGAPAGLDALVS